MTLQFIIVKEKIPCVSIDFAPLPIFSSTSRRSSRVRAVASRNVFLPIPSVASSRTIPLASPAELISLRVCHYPLPRVF